MAEKKNQRVEEKVQFVYRKKIDFLLDFFNDFFRVFWRVLGVVVAGLGWIWVWWAMGGG
jgi:hypothetical protein